MKIAHFHESSLSSELKLSGFYMMEDDNAEELRALGACTLAEADMREEIKKVDPSSDLNGKRVLFVRSGGIGDLLFMTPTIAKLKRLWPEVKIDVCCMKKLMPVLVHNPDIDNLIAYPVALSRFRAYDAHVWLDGFIERDVMADITHAADLAAARASLNLEDRRLHYFATVDELTKAREDYPETGVCRVGIQVLATAPCRTYPPHLTVALVRQMLAKGWEVFLFGEPGTIPSDSGPKLTNLTQRQPAPDIRESVAIMATCDAMVTPDSSLCHLAGAMEIPTVALYGPFLWQLRTAYAPSVFAINGHGPCAPCFHHNKAGGLLFPENGPCAKTGKCEVLATITPQRIIAKIEKLTEKKAYR